MSHFAEVDERGVVLRVIVAEQGFIDSGAVGDPARWVQCSYRTHEGKHPEGRPLRLNYPGVGWKHNKVIDGFTPPKPFPSWALDANTGQYVPPVAAPRAGMYSWDERTKAWLPAKS